MWKFVYIHDYVIVSLKCSINGLCESIVFYCVFEFNMRCCCNLREILLLFICFYKLIFEHCIFCFDSWLLVCMTWVTHATQAKTPQCPSMWSGISKHQFSRATITNDLSKNLNPLVHPSSMLLPTMAIPLYVCFIRLICEKFEIWKLWWMGMIIIL